MPHLKIYLFDSFEAIYDGKPLTEFDSDKVRALLAYLAVEADRPHRREALAGLLWPDTPERIARTNLRSALANVRQVIRDQQEDPAFLLVTRQTIQFNRASDSWVDASVFAEQVDRYIGIQSSAEGRGHGDPAVTALHQAVALYRGQFLARFYVRNAPQFEEWALITRESLQRQALRALHLLTEVYQEAGDHERALLLAQRQVELEPYQEVAHQQVMWALALSGRRNEALVHYDRFCELLQTELGVSPLEQTQEMHSRLLAGELPGSPTTNLILRREPRVVGSCPYLGLAAFREADAPFFYGRDEFTERLTETVKQQISITVIVGSSGSGKSSAVFAGLVPKLRANNNWLIVDMRPGSQPFRTLAATLISNFMPTKDEPKVQTEAQELCESLQEGENSLFNILLGLLEMSTSTSRLLLVIDQFEELYTLCPDVALHRRFLDTLLSAVEKGKALRHPPFVLLITLRADFISQALSYRPFADILNDYSLILGPMDQDELRAAIEKPAQQQGAAFEPGLVTRILNDVGEEPGNLPLLEFALTQLWQQLDQGWLTHAAYEEIGQVGGALAGYAEEVFLALDQDKQQETRHVFVQLVQPGRGTEDTRRLAVRHEFDAGRWELIQYLADTRLVVTGQDNEGIETVEIIHEALIREWSRLGDWMDLDRSFRMWQEDLRTALYQWEDSGRNEGALLRGVALSKAETWLNERDIDLSELEHQFIQASLHERTERQVAETIRQKRERSLERRSRTFLRVLIIVLLLATMVSIGFAWVARQEARQAIEASSLSLAANARQALSDKDTTSALVLAMAANRIEQPPLEAQRILMEAAFSPGPRELFAVNETFVGVEGPPLSVAISPDGRAALTGYFGGDIILWDIQTGTEIRRFIGHAPGNFDPARIVAYSGVNDIALTPDGSLALSGGDDGVVILWDVNTGREIHRCEGHSGAIRAVAIMPDGLKGVSGGLSGASPRDPGELILWDLKTGREIRRFEGNPEAVVDIALSPDGRTVLASSGEVDYVTTPGQVYSLIQWDIESGEIIHHYEGIDRDIPALDISPMCVPSLNEAEEELCDRLILTASADHNLYLWSMETGEQLQILEGHTDLVRAVAFSPNGRRAVSGSGDGELILWNLEKGEVISRFNVHTAGIDDIAFSPDSRNALSVAADGTIILWDLTNAAQINRFEGHDAAVLDVAYTPKGNHFISASGLPDPAAPIIEEDSLRLWNLEDGEQIGTIDWHLSDIFQIDISPDGRRLLTGLMLDQSVRLWDLATGHEIRRFEGHRMPVLSVAFTPDGRRALSGAVDSMIILWNLETGEEIQQLSGHEGGIWALAVSPDGRTTLSGADDRLLIWWDLETGKQIQRFEGHNETVSGVAFSPDGRRAISGDTIGNLIEWDLERGEVIQRFTGHGGTGPVGRTRVAYTPDGNMALTSGWDGTLALWDLQTGKELYRFKGHDTDFIFDVAISPDGRTALSCGTDQTIIQWHLDIPTQEVLLDWIAANRYVRQLTCDERELFQIEPMCPAK